MIPSKFDSILATGFGIMSKMSEQNKNWEERILSEWQESKSMPRKKKKQVRKSLLLDYGICKYAQNEFGLGLFE